MTRYTPYEWADGEAGGTPITAARLNIIEAALDLDIPMADLETTGTPDGTKFLRDDGEWATPAGGGATDLDDLTDVDVSTTPPTDGQALVFDTADSLWKPATISGGSTPDASETVKGIVELATTTEVTTGTDTTRAVTPAGVAAAIATVAKKDATFSYGPTLVVGTGTQRIYNRSGATRTLHLVSASVGTQPTGAAVIIDVNRNGTTIFTTQSNRPQIAVSTNEDVSGAPDVTTWADGDYLTIDIDQIGSTIAGANLTVTVVYS